MNSLSDNEQYYLIPNYTMKCRLYPNKDAAKMIDRIIRGASKAYNKATYEMKTDYTNTKEFALDDGETLHYVDYKTLTSAGYLNHLRSLDDDIAYVPANVLSGNQGIFMADHKKAMSHKAIYKTTKIGTKRKTHESTARTKGTGYNPYSVEVADIDFYNSRHPRTSYTYQLNLQNVITATENPNVFYIRLNASSSAKENHQVKVRGWNQNIRFGENQSENFLEMVKNSYSGTNMVTIIKDNCGDYWICFKLSNVYNPMTVRNDNKVGVDVGIKDTMITSNGDIYENKRFKKQESAHLKQINKQLSRSQGWSNPEFRKKYKEDMTLKPSKRYEAKKIQYAKISRSIANKRTHYNNCITHDIIANNGMIAIETLDVMKMRRKKDKFFNFALSDAAMSEILNMLVYKGGWYGRDIRQIAQRFPSSKRCSCCGYIMPVMPLNVREWDCPKCKAHHHRDINSGLNLLWFMLVLEYFKATIPSIKTYDDVIFIYEHKTRTLKFTDKNNHTLEIPSNEEIERVCLTK